MSVTSASNLCFLSGRPLISIWTIVHKVRRLWLVTDIHAYIADFHANVCVDIAENHADVRNFSQCPLHVRRASADIWDMGRAIVFSGPSNPNVSNLNVPKIKPLQAFTYFLVTSNFDDDSIKNKQASMETSISHYKSTWFKLGPDCRKK